MSGAAAGTGVIVTDEGFAPDGWTGGVLDLGPDAEPAREMLDAPMIRVAFPGFADGRGFTIARRLRLMGYEGRLRASGHVIADQYPMARRAGFDEVEIPRELAARQPEAHWRARADWRAHDYQARLGRRDGLSQAGEPGYRGADSTPSAGK